MTQVEKLNPNVEGVTKQAWELEMEREKLSSEDGPQSLASVLEEIDPIIPEQRNENIHTITLPSSVLIDLIDYTKVSLVKIRQMNHDSVDRMDLESRKSLEKTMNQEIKKIDSVLNQFLNYINVSTPVVKANTILTILDEILEGKGNEFYYKGITITKKYEKNLPETCIHDEHLKFILNSIFQHAILASPPNGRIGLFTRTVHIENLDGNEKNTPMKETGKTHIEIMVVLMDGKRSLMKLEDAKGSLKREKIGNIILHLVKDVVRRYRGLVDFKIFEKDSSTVIGLKLPISENQVVAYEPIKL